jgi:hypothetical protein
MPKKLMVLFAVAGLLVLASAGPNADLATPTKKHAGQGQVLDRVPLVPTKSNGTVLPAGIDANKVIEHVRHAPKPEPPPQPLGDPFTENEFMPAPAIVPKPSPGTQSATAFDGENYLVVWTDPRDGNGDIYGARVNQSGVVLDTAGIAIRAVPGFPKQCPAVAFDNVNRKYLVVWQEDNGSSDIEGALVSTDGRPGDVFPIGPHEDAYYQQNPSVAFDDTIYLVVWQDDRNSGTTGWDIYGARVNTAGTVLDASGRPISTETNDQQSPSVAFDGANFLVAWQDCRNSGTTSWDIYGTRVNQAGVYMDTVNIAISTASYEQSSPAVAFDDTIYLVVWEDYRNCGTGEERWDIYGARVNSAGTVLDASGRPISTEDYDQRSPSVAYDGENFLVVWEDCRNNSSSAIYGTRVNQAGVYMDTVNIAISTAANGQSSPSVAFGGGKYFVAWQDARISGWGGSIYICGARVSTAGVVQDPDGIVVTHNANNQTSSAVAFDGTNYLVVWADDRGSGYSDICGALVTPAGNGLGDPAGFVISTNTPTSCQLSPAVAFDGTNYLVAWEDYRYGWHNEYGWHNGDIYGARVNTAGTVLDANGRQVSTADSNQLSPAVAFDKTTNRFLVVWQDKRNGVDPYSVSDIYGALVSTEGGVTDIGAITTAEYDQLTPSVAFDGANYLVVWEDYRNYGGRFADIYGVRVNTDGKTVGDDIAISTDKDNQQRPAVAFDTVGKNYLVVWEDDRGYFNDVYGARVSEDGEVLDTSEIAIATGPGDQLHPTVAFVGPYCLVVWMDGPYQYPDIRGCLMDQVGKVLKRFPISTPTGTHEAPAVAGGLGRAMVTYDRPTATVGAINYRGAARIWARPGTLAQPGDVSTDSILRPVAHFLVDETSWPVPPLVRIRNYGSSDAGQFNVKFFISPGGYMSEKSVPSLAAGATCLVEFDPFTLDTGLYTARCTTSLAGDPDSDNDALTACFQGCDFINFFDEDSGDFTPDGRPGEEWGWWAYGKPEWPWSLPPMDSTVWGIGSTGGGAGGDLNSTLTSPTYVALQDNPAIAFQHNYSTDTFTAGGNFSYSTDGLQWDSLFPSAGLGYSCPVSALGDSWGWSGSQWAPTGWNQSVFTIPVNADEEFQVRWRCAAIDMHFGYGWLIDEVAGIGCKPTDKMGAAGVIDTLKFWPNPVRGTGLVSYTLRKAGNVSVKLYDITGALVARLANGSVKRGLHTAKMDARRLASGIYFVKLESASDSKTTKVIVE